MNKLTDSQMVMNKGCGDNEWKRSTELSLGVVISILNLVEIIMIAKLGNKKKIYEDILLSLSLSDCMFGLSNVLINIVVLVNECDSEALLETTYTLYIFSILSSIFHLMFITFDRVIAVRKPLKHKIFLTRKKVKIFLLLLWIMAVLISALLLLLDELTETFKVNKAVLLMEDQHLAEIPFPDLDKVNGNTTLNQSLQNVTMITEKASDFSKDMALSLSVVIIIADIAMVASYSLIIYEAALKRKVASNQGKFNKLPFVCLAIVATFILFTLPYAVVKLATGKIPFWANFILISNSAMNSIVYFFRGKILKCRQMNIKKEAVPQKLISIASSSTAHADTSKKAK